MQQGHQSVLYTPVPTFFLQRYLNIPLGKNGNVFLVSLRRCLTLQIIPSSFLCVLGNCVMDLILDLLDLPHPHFSLSSSLFPYLLSPGVRTSAWPLRTQRPGETWMTPTPHPLWAPRDRPAGDTSPRVETTPVNSVRASAGLLHPLSSSFIPMLWLSCDLLWGLVHLWGGGIWTLISALSLSDHFIWSVLIKRVNPSWVRTTVAVSGP